MIPFSLLAQIDLTETLDKIGQEYGALAVLFSAILLMLFFVWRNQMNAQLEREKAATERAKARNEEIRVDTERDILVNELAKKSGMQSDEIAKLREDLAEQRGASKLLSEQLQTERDNRQKEREELKTAIRDLKTRHDENEKKIEALTHELNGKAERIKALELERDFLNTQLADKDAQIARLNNTMTELVKSKEVLEKTLKEQSEQIQSLAKQLAELDPPSATVAQSAVNPAHEAIHEKTQALDAEELSKLEEKDKTE